MKRKIFLALCFGALAGLFGAYGFETIAAATTTSEVLFGIAFCLVALILARAAFAVL